MKIEIFDENGVRVVVTQGGTGGGGITDATYILQTANAGLPNAQALEVISQQIGGVLLKVADGGVIIPGVPGVDYIVRGMVAIERTTVGATPLSEIVFDNLPSFSQFLVMGHARCNPPEGNPGAGYAPLIFELNDDDASVDYQTAWQGAADGVFEADYDDSQLKIPAAIAWSQSETRIFGTFHAWFINPVSVAPFRTMRFNVDTLNYNDVAGFRSFQGSGVWQNTQGIVKMKLIPGFGAQFQEGTSVTVLGVGFSEL